MVLIPAPEAQLGQVWREPQETNPSIFKMFPQTFFASVGLSTCFTSSHSKSPVPGEGVRRYRNVPPPAQGQFLS